MIDEKVLLQSRPEALNDKMDMDLQNQKGGYNNGWNDCLFMFIDRIKKQPKVGKWIPVTERLPEEHESVFAKFYGTDRWDNAFWRARSEEVLVCIEYDDGSRSVTISVTLDGKWHIERRRVLHDFKVIAWMTLPEPMKEEEKITMYSDTEYLNKLEIVRKLVGNYETIGDASIDPDRVKNLEELCTLTGELVDIIADEAYKIKRYEGSVQSSGDVSINCLKYIKEQVDDALDDLEEYIK